ncbi:MAG TPA: hypothetical protein VJG83_06750 [archaeon]|nr:hypothetical protein [archaeon]
MFIIDFIKKIFSGNKSVTVIEPHKTSSIYTVHAQETEEIHSVWDYIKLNENTQAAHIAAVLGFDEWIAMEEILRRIKELFGMDYKNDRSLYPYIKTLVDVGLIETTNVGGKKKWRKRDVLIKLKAKKRIEEEETEQAAAQTKN